MTDPIADMLIRIKNASLRKKPFCKVPFSKMKFEISKVLQRENFVSDLKIKGKGVRKNIEIVLAYEKGEPRVKEVKKISKPGRRIYEGWNNLNKFGRRGTLILSTSQGILTAKEARLKKVGGEVLFKVSS